MEDSSGDAAALPPLHESPPAAAPPTAPVEVAAAPERAVWPLVLGIVLIIFGAGGLLLYLWGVVSTLFLQDLVIEFSAAGDPDVAAAAAASVQRYGIPLVAVSFLQALVAGLLLTAGVGMVRRRRWSITAARVWAWSKIVLTIGSVVVQAMMQRDQFQAMSQTAGAPGLPGGFLNVMLVFIVLFGLLWGWALPIVVLVWLRLDRARREIAMWNGSMALSAHPGSGA